jgi:hypothetical protein
MRVVGLAGWSPLAANGTDSIVLDFRYVGVENLK